MLRYFILVSSVLLTTLLSAQEKMYLHSTDKITRGALLSSIDSIYFNTGGSVTNFRINSQLYSFSTGTIDSISFGENSSVIELDFNGSTVKVINPLAFEGVDVKMNGAYITITSATETKDVTYQLTGSSSNGMLKIYSEKRFNLILNGVSITNPYGPAINIQSDNKATITVSDGTTNYLSDGSSYDDAPLNSDDEEEDQKATFFSEGKMVFTGNGLLTIESNGNDQHALGSDDEIDFESGTIEITQAVKDGIHAKNGLFMTGGNLQIQSSGDGIDGDEGVIDISGGEITITSTEDDNNAITCDSTFSISGGIFTISVSGDQSKGFKSDQTMTLSGGTINLTVSGNTVLESSGSGYDPSYCSAIKSDSIILIDGASITIKSSGKGGKGISSDTDITMNSGTVSVTLTGAGATYKNSSGVTDAYNSTGFSTDNNLSIIGGSVTITNSGSGGKGISTDGSLTIGSSDNSPNVTITTTGSSITISSGNYAEAKAISSDGAVEINNGITTISSNDDGIKSTISITINNGTVTISKSTEGMESPLITINNGTVSIVASDDGFNATYGNGGENNDGSLLKFTGGFISVNASGGDGLDSNGSISLTGGTVAVHGPQSQPEVGMDYNGTCNVSGGLMVISGPNSSNMLQAPSTSSSQYSLKITTNSTISANTLFHIQDVSGNTLVTFKPARSYGSVIFTSPLLQNGATYSIYTGGTSTGTNHNGLYTDGTYSGGTLKKSFTVSGKVTAVSF